MIASVTDQHLQVLHRRRHAEMFGWAKASWLKRALIEVILNALSTSAGSMNNQQYHSLQKLTVHTENTKHTSIYSWENCIDPPTQILGEPWPTWVA